MGAKVFLLTFFVLFLGSSSQAQATRLKKRNTNKIITCYHPNVASLVVTDIDGVSGTFEVEVTVNDRFKSNPGNYIYYISGGKILGSGRNVQWDTTGLIPGLYTLTAGLDDGCGVCGQTKTYSLIVK